MTQKVIESDKILPKSIEVFEVVSEKIIDLIGCSVKDFEILNATFKDCFSRLQLVASASNNFIELLVGLQTNQDFTVLKAKNETINIKLNEKLSFYLTELKKIDKELNYYLLLINNLKQDLSTLKLLFTNLKFDPLVEIDYTNATDKLGSLEHFLLNIERSINDIHAQLYDVIKFTDEGFIGSLDLLSDHLDGLRSYYYEISQLGNIATKQQKKLKALEVKRASSASEIITNLQFQDILRQKIEHVQTAYNEISNELKTAQNKNEEIQINDLYNIRDISSLQSAQLIYSNQEYQNAVETIMHRINELNTFLSEYYSNWNHFCKPESSKLFLLKSKIGDKLSLIESHLFSLTHINDKFNSIVQLILKKQNHLYDEILENKQFVNANSELLTLDSEIKTLLKENTKNSSLIQISNELKKFKDCFNKLSTKLYASKKYFNKKKLHSTLDLKNEIENIRTTTNKNSDYFKSQFSTKLESLHSQNLNFDSISNFNLKEVAYYKNFEKEIHEIINLLDNLLLEINVNNNEIDLKRLEHLKSMYTMDSERDIHNLITGLYSYNEDKDNNKNDEVEFF